MPGDHQHPVGERGDAIVEAVIVVPVLLLLIMLVIQFGLWYHAAHVAEAAAQEGVRAARYDTGTAADGEARGREFMAAAAPRLVRGVVVTAERDAETARVEVNGAVESLVPGLDLRVHGDAVSQVERFRGDTP